MMIEMHWTLGELEAMPNETIERILILMNAKSTALQIARQKHG